MPRFLLHLFCVALWGATPASAALSPDLAVAGGGANLWLVRPVVGETAVGLYHYDAAADDPAVRKTGTLNGRLRGWAIAASPTGDTCWLAFDGGAVEALRATRHPLTGYVGVTRRHLPRLPGEARVRAVAGDDDQVWLLLNLDDPATLDKTVGEADTPSDQGLTFEERLLILDLPVTPSGPAAEASPPAAGPAAQESAASNQDGAPEPNRAPKAASSGVQPDATPPPARRGAVDVLLHLHRGSWRELPLPVDWAHGRRAWLAVTDGQAPTLTLLSRHADTLHVDRLDTRPTLEHTPSDAWRRTSHDLGSALFARPLIVERQLVLPLHRPSDAGQVVVEPVVVRPGGIVSAGTMTLPTGKSARWGVLTLRDTVALAALPDTGDVITANAEPPALSITTLDLHARATEPVQAPLVDEDRSRHSADFAVLMTVMMAATVMMFLFWRRDPLAHRLQLPPDLAIADLTRRALAGLIDFAPGFALVMWHYGLSVEQVFYRWPGLVQGMDWATMTPALVSIGVYVAHTTPAELLTGRSLGKALTGLRLTDLHGRRPRPGPALLRGLLKPVDLVAFLLLAHTLDCP